MSDKFKSREGIAGSSSRSRIISDKSSFKSGNGSSDMLDKSRSRAGRSSCMPPAAGGMGFGSLDVFFLPTPPICCGLGCICVAIIPHNNVFCLLLESS